MHPERSRMHPERSRMHPERSRMHPERSRMHPERSRGVGLYTGVLVSASLDEQFLSEVEEHVTSQGYAPSSSDIFLLQDNSDNMLPQVARTFRHDEILWYEQVHE